MRGSNVYIESGTPKGLNITSPKILAGNIELYVTDRCGLGVWVAQNKIRCARCAAKNYYGSKMMSFAALLIIKSIFLPKCHPYGICVGVH